MGDGADPLGAVGVGAGPGAGAVNGAGAGQGGRPGASQSSHTGGGHWKGGREAEAYSSRLGLSQIRNKWIYNRCCREDVGSSCSSGGLNPFLQGSWKENARRQ